MDVTDIPSTSVLKKPDALSKKLKKVSFNNTVKLYIDDPSKNTKSENGYTSQMKWVEINIVDKSNNSVLPDTNEDCKVTDFLVHKVVYDNYILPEDDNDLDIKNEDHEETIVFESTYDEGLEFVVHKVTEYEDDLIEKESEFDDTCDELQNECTDIQGDNVKESSKLSIQNILEHDKIIAFIDQKNLCLPLQNLNINDSPNIGADKLKDVLPEKNNSRIGLSPPLQELSLEKIVKAHSDNILTELDISPLNSVQETDSDSDLSSEGTMIMMTSEECEKNEQHIKESLLKYQSMKERVKAKTDEKDVQLHTETSDVVEHESVKNTTNRKLKLLHDNLLNQNPNSFDNDSQSNIVLNCDSSTQLHNSVQISFNVSSDPPASNDNHNFSLSDAELLHSICNNSFQNLPNKPKKDSFNEDIFWDQSLTSVEIPKDVREWKILLKSFEHCEDTFSHCENVQVQSTKQSDIDKIHSNISQTGNFSTSSNDELENFVHENTERVERIRKRYHINGKQQNKQQFFENSSFRGVRPRFGSTAQILQLMQKQSCPPFYAFSETKTHMSWPCDDAGSDVETRRNMRHKHFYVSQSLSSDCSSQSSFDSDECTNSTNCDDFSDSCSSILTQERERPEGASPPTHRSEDWLEQSYDGTSDSYVYFSMKV